MTTSTNSTVKHRRLCFERFEDRRLLSATPLDATVRFRLEVTSDDGQPIDSVETGQYFSVNVYVADQRPNPQGVFAAYLDLLFDESRVARAGDLEFSDQYPNVRADGGRGTGMLDEVGAVASLFTNAASEASNGESLLLRAPFRAMSAGPVDFSTDAPDLLPSSHILLFGTNDPVDISQVAFETAAFEIVPANFSRPAPRPQLNIATPASVAEPLSAESQSTLVFDTSANETIQRNGTLVTVSLPIPATSILNPSTANSRWQLTPDRQLRHLSRDLAIGDEHRSAHIDHGWIDLPIGTHLEERSHAKPLDLDSSEAQESSNANHHQRDFWQELRSDRNTSSIRSDGLVHISSLRRDFVRITWNELSSSRSVERLVSLTNDISLLDMIDISQILHATEWNNATDAAVTALLVEVDGEKDIESEEELVGSPLIEEVEMQAVRGSAIALEVGVAASTQPKSMSQPEHASKANSDHVDAGPPTPNESNSQKEPTT